MMRVETLPEPMYDVVPCWARVLRKAWQDADYARMYPPTQASKNSFEEEQLEVLDSIASSMRRPLRHRPASQTAAMLSLLSHLGARP